MASLDIIMTFHGILLNAVLFLFTGRKDGSIRHFCQTLLLWLLIQTTVNFVLQLSGQFHYVGIITFHTIIALIIISKYSFCRIKFGQIISDGSQECFSVIVVAAISFLCLVQIHFFYSGIYSSVQHHMIQPQAPMRYVYPYFSDEWNAVAMIRHVIETQGLPVTNPYFSFPVEFLNFELFFHSFIAGFFLLLNLDPVTAYTKVTIVFGVIIVLLCYLILRQSKVGRLASVVGSLGVLFITNSANLPGLWNLMPVTLGVIGMLLTMYFYLSKQKKYMWLSCFTMLLFYPPLFIVFFIPFCIVLFMQPQNKTKEILIFLGGGILVAGILSLIVFTTSSLGKGLFAYIFSKIFFLTSTKGANPSFNVFYIIPIPVLVLAVFGLKDALRRNILGVLLIGVLICFWGIYANTLYRVMIEYARVVYVTSIMVCLLSGFGLDWIFCKIERVGFYKKILKGCLVLVAFVIFLYGTLNYTSGQNWQKLVLNKVDGSGYFLPAAVANRYLDEDDLRIFSPLKEKRFLSLPWKGIVIGSATNNDPATTKEGTITVNASLFKDFVKGTCYQKWVLAHNFDINYVYLPAFQCPHFQAVDQSQEGLVLYEFYL